MTSVGSILVTALCLEVLLRFLPVNEGRHTLAVNADSPILRFEPNRTFQLSRRWNFSFRNTVRVNNYGFISNIDYEESPDVPIVAVVGDSYIEAAMIPWEKTIAGRLNKKFDGERSFYAFGASGSALAQYLMFAEFAGEHFSPDKLIVCIIGNDFDESLLKYKSTPGQHYFVENKSGDLVLERIDFRISLARKLVRSSRLGMYLATNINPGAAYASLRNVLDHKTGNALGVASPERVKDSKTAVDRFLELLPRMSGLPPSQIVLVLDGIRPELYDEMQLRRVRDSYSGQMRDYTIKAADRLGYQMIDMQPIFVGHHEKWGQRFEFPNDVHWNALGHQVVTEEIVKTISDLLKRSGE